MTRVPSLVEVATDLGLLNQLPLDVLVDLRRQIGHLAADADAAITLRAAQGAGRQPVEPSEERHLTIAEVATRTGLSASYLYELARAGQLPVSQMGGRRGYRVLLGDLRAWEASRRKDAATAQLSTMLDSAHDRPRVPTARALPRAHPGGAREPARRPSDHAQPLGARPVPHSGGRPAAATPGEGPA